MGILILDMTRKKSHIIAIIAVVGIWEVVKMVVDICTMACVAMVHQVQVNVKHHVVIMKNKYHNI